MAVSFAKDVLPLFTRDDIDHMKPFSVFLDDYGWMSAPAGGSVANCNAFPDHGNARSVYGYLTGECQPRMPMGGPFWDTAKLALFKHWMDDAFQA